MSDAFATRLLEWFAASGRKDLPWQVNRTPYRVWISEIMLQQTQVATVVPYYLRFTEAFPDLAALARAEQEDVLRHWSGLGYYARARNLHGAARIIVERHGGRFPERFEDVVALPGIGRSTAGAILSLACGQRHAILDGNVKRVLARRHAVEGWPGTPAVAAKLWQHAERHTPRENVAEYNQAMMDLGATVCTRVPDCGRCPVRRGCRARMSSRQALYPGRRGKQARRRRRTHMALAIAEGLLYLEKRGASGIWGGLWSLPEFGSEAEILDWCEQRLAVTPLRLEPWEPLRHSFSHFDLDITPVAVRLASASRNLSDGGAGAWHALGEAPRLGLAAPVRKLIEKVRANANG